jgi:hypothetical protein
MTGNSASAPARCISCFTPMRHSPSVQAIVGLAQSKEAPMPRIASVIVLAAATLAGTADAQDFINRISDTAWNANGQIVQRLGNMVIWNDG